MKEIIFIGSVHDEIGASNSTELFKIFESISPDVIFIEFDTEHYNGMISGQYLDKLETSAIKLYLAKKKVRVVPVDLNWYPIMEPIMEDGFREMTKTFYQNAKFIRSISYFSEHSEMVGFKFLNSQDCLEVLDYKQNIEREILDKYGNDHFNNLYTRYRQMHHDREMEMLKNTYNFSTQNQYRIAIFLVGTEHKRSIIDKVQVFEDKYDMKIKWNFNFFNL
ncbi:MAG: hypothetical protein IPO45_17030 [Saprospiraceae bacterium]|jgi:hypothetical protein|uniref:hypothetical protein n=1 Tax=Candidatus Brachybacter algidus TaxID=2982024 RepID=UPI001B54A4BE|nr:hypothetical protein [Candidatus Brachybacter algidus]MBP7305311.1 hypothetical protein [Saprospiraceae bacterium]MBK6450069.1 hypothetical protein [Candidatus Brachybacter algidus]MBK8353950.1 hypothetical protein [Candidatus Brachybacter algidus]MBK8841636.1 hypothetical protein [Candidatus Brachybacter algidus]MBK9553859.1 hypothetical protein [Candidatus Brachybacter algidus]